MANKKILFKDKPSQNGFGIYTFIEGNNSDPFSHENSNSVPLKYDKFEGKDLYTTSIGDKTNEIILDSKIQNSLNSSVDDLKYQGATFIQINNLHIDNRGVNSAINDVYFEFFMFSSVFFNPYTSTGALRSYNAILAQLRGNNEWAWFYDQHGPNYGDGGSPGDFPGLQNITIVEGFDSINFGAATAVASSPDYVGKKSNFNPRAALRKIGTTIDTTGATLTFPATEDDSGDLTTIFQQDSTPNPYYFAVHMDGDQNPSHSGDRSRNQTLAIYEFDAYELFNHGGDSVQGKVTELTWDTHTSQTYSSGKRTAAFTAKELKITISTQSGVEQDVTYFPPPEVPKDILDDIIPPLYTASALFDDIFINMFPNRQIIETDIANDIAYQPSSTNRQFLHYFMGPYAEYLPIAVTNIDTSAATDNYIYQNPYDFQSYYSNVDDRTFVSAPNNVELNFFTSYHPFSSSTPSVETTDLYLTALPENVDEGLEVTPYTDTWFGENSGFDGDPNDDSDYIFFVVDWDDINNKYKTIDDVLIDWPRNKTQLLKKRTENLYKISTIDRNSTLFKTKQAIILKNNYTTSGIKNIKTIMFNYNNKTNTYEPLRWKLITSRIFLDIPINEFPDFGEVGGSDYTTIPWPYATPVIGGVSETSKYLKSVDDTLGSGKIGDSDIIDETFLVDVQENDELGTNIEKLDLEQVRYFNKSYSMGELLKIPTTTTLVVDSNVETLETLEFPIWYEEFDVSPGGSETIDELDVNQWIVFGRPDIADWIDRNLSETSFDDSGYTFPDNLMWPPPHYPVAEIFMMSSENGNPSGGAPTINSPPSLVRVTAPPSDDSLFGDNPPGTGDFQECFVAGTQVLLSDNSYKNIENIKINEYVKSYNIETNKLEDKPVVKLLNDIHSGKDGDHTIIMKFSDGSQNHNTTTNPYWVKDKGWATFDVERHKKLYKWDCVQIEVGDICYKNVDGQLKEIELVSIKEVFDEIETFNIIVEDNHNYFATDILVHNKHGQHIGPDVSGCMDATAINYNPWATQSNGSCAYTYSGCTDPAALNYNYEASPDDGSCQYPPDPYIFDTWVSWFQAASGYNYESIESENLYTFISSDGIITTPMAIGSTQLFELLLIDGITTSYIIEWAYENFWEGYESSQTYTYTDPLVNGCQLPENHFFIKPSGEVLYNLNNDSSNYIQGFQIYLPSSEGYIINNSETNTGVYGGAAEASSFDISHSETVILGFSMTNITITGCGTLFNLNLNQLWNDSPIDGHQPISWVFSSESATDANMDYFEHTAGCTDDMYASPASYNALATWNDGSCEYDALRLPTDFNNFEEIDYPSISNPYTDISASLTQTNGYWDGSTPESTFSEETSVGQIFIGDNIDNELKSNCQLELNTGNLSNNSIYDSSGNGSKGLLIGDYKIKKTQKNRPMKRDSFIKTPKKTNNKDGAL